MAYKIDFTEYGADTRDNCVEYLLYKVGGTGNPQAAKNFFNELDHALDTLEKMADSFALCDHPTLRASGIRKLHFKRMAYKVFYHIEGNTVIIDAVYSDRRDYETLLS